MVSKRKLGEKRIVKTSWFIQSMIPWLSWIGWKIGMSFVLQSFVQQLFVLQSGGTSFVLHIICPTERKKIICPTHHKIYVYINICYILFILNRSIYSLWVKLKWHRVKKCDERAISCRETSHYLTFKRPQRSAS